MTNRQRRIVACPAKCNNGWVLDRKKMIQVPCRTCRGQGHLVK